MTVICSVYRAESATLQSVKTAYVRLKATRAISGVGALRLELLEQDATDIPLQPDLRIVVERVAEGGHSSVYGTYLLCGWERIQAGNDRRITLLGLCMNSLLSRRIVAYPAGSSQARKTGLADNLMRAVVRENLGATAGTGRNITAWGFSVESNLSLSSSVEASFAYDNVLDVVNRIADIARAKHGHRLVWDCVPLAEGWSVQFRVRQACFCDKRMSSVNPLWIGVENDVLARAEMILDRRGKVNFIYAGGQGENEARMVVTASNSNDIALSPVARSEAFCNSTHLTTTDSLTDAARQRLNELLPRREVRVDIAETPWMRYGRELLVGDAVTVRAGFGELDMLLRWVQLDCDASGERVSFTLEEL